MLPPEEVVDLVVGLRDHFHCPGSAPIVPRGGLLLRRSVDQGSQVSSSEVGQLDRKLGVLQDAISEDLLVPEADVGVALQHLGVFSMSEQPVISLPQNPFLIRVIREIQINLYYIVKHRPQGSPPNLISAAKRSDAL